MTTPNVTATQSQFHEPIERSTPRSDTLALKVTAVALGILISMSAFALVGPIEGIIVTTIVCVAPITLFNENTGSGYSSPPVFVGGGTRREPAPLLIIQEERRVERRPWFSGYVPLFEPTPPPVRRDSPLRREPPHVSVGNGAQTPIPRQIPPPPRGYDPVPVAPRDQRATPPVQAPRPAASFYSASVTPGRETLAAQPTRVGVGTREVTRATPVPGDRVVVGSGRRP